MRIEFTKVTWYSRMLSIIFFFGVFPYLIFIIGQRYQQYIDVISGATYLSMDSYNSNLSDNSDAYSKLISIFERKIEGKWRSVDDEDFVIIFRDLNRYFEYHSGSLANSGVWFMKTNLDKTKYANLPNGNYLYERLINEKTSTNVKSIKNSKTELAEGDFYEGTDFIYRVSFAPDYSELFLTALDTNKVIKFKREAYSPGGMTKTTF